MGKYKAKVEEKTSKKKKNVIKNEKILNDNELELKRLIIIAIIVILFIVGIYFLTVMILNKRSEKPEDTTKASINYNSVIVGTMLNRPYDNYYVLVYDSSESFASYLQAASINYSNKDNSKKVFTCDLGLDLNSKYKADKNNSNPNAKTVDEFAFGEATIIEVKNGAIVNYVEGVEQIVDLLA